MAHSPNYMYSIFIGVIIVELYRIDIRIQSAYGGQQTHNEILSKTGLEM